MASSSLLLLQRSSSSLPSIPKLYTSRLSHGFHSSSRVTLFPNYKNTHLLKFQRSRSLSFTCFYNSKEKAEANPTKKGSTLNWPVLERWDVPWQWQTVLLTMVACGASFALTVLVEASALPYLGFQSEEVSLDEKAEILFAGQFTVTAGVLEVVYSITNNFRPLPDDLFRYDLKGPFNLRNGWVLWAGIGLFGAIITVALTGAALTFFSEEPPQRETDALIRLLPLIVSSGISTACLVGVTGVVAPVLEETVFPKISNGLLDQVVSIFLRTALGLSYAQTRNLMTPITIHAFWNSGVILLLTFLQLQGYDIRELLQAS